MGATKYDWTDRTETGFAKEEFDALWTAVNVLPGNLADIGDVTITAVADHELLAFDSGGPGWVNMTPTEAGLDALYEPLGTTHAVDDLSDAVITSVADNEVLAYDSGSGDWINQTATEAGIDLSLYLPLTGGTLSGELVGAAGIRITDGFFNIGVLSNKTIAAGVVTATRSHHSIEAQSGGVDDLDTINGGVAGNILIIRPKSGDTITIKASGGNIKTLDNADIVLSVFKDSATFIYHGTKWYEIAGFH